MGLGICFGLLFGVVLSVLMDSWAMIGVGVAMGPAFALVPFGQDDEDDEDDKT
ncbi:hypothetical protein [Nocardioides solisilvae]|uniref:hypothetical protein n=1 Tax=Nocardioides solisilvae TaxID=1542435 RepID=UPI0013A5B02C|nr:hypothetical protein [Nocardioides solisilvae]